LSSSLGEKSSLYFSLRKFGLGHAHCECRGNYTDCSDVTVEWNSGVV